MVLETNPHLSRARATNHTGNYRWRKCCSKEQHQSIIVHFPCFKLIWFRASRGTILEYWMGRGCCILRRTQIWSVNESHNAMALKQQLQQKVPLKVIGLVQLDRNGCRDRRNQASNWGLQDLQLICSDHFEKIERKISLRKKVEHLMCNNLKLEKHIHG